MKIIFSILLISISFQAYSADSKYEIFANKTTPYGTEFKELGKSKGLIIELLEAALLEAKIDLAKPTREQPWAKAQLEGKDVENSLILPFARTPAREPNYKWISILLDEKLYAYAKRGQPLPKSFDGLKTMKGISVTLGSAPESKIKDLGVKFESAFTETENFKKLSTGGSVKVILSQGYIGNYEIKGLGDKGKAIERSESLVDLPLWIATSTKTSDEAIAKVRAAVEKFKSSPNYKKIIESY